jgi:dCTP deaminase
MILTDREIRLEIDDGNIRFEPDIDRDLQIGDASVDVRLGRYLRIPETDLNIAIRPTTRNRPELYGAPKEIDPTGYNLPSNKLVLASTYEKLTLPNYLIARLEGKSSLARFGLLVHATSAHIDPGFSGVIILELFNLGPNIIVLEAMMPIAHILFEKVSMPPSKSYSGQFAEQLRP